MKFKWMLLIPAAAWLIWAAVHAEKADAGKNPLELAVESAVMMDAETGEWLYTYRGNEPMPPASMSKMMTELLVLDEISDGNLKWADKVTVSAYAAEVAGASMGLRPGQEVSVRELFDAMAIHSANDAAVALAERAAGSERAFVDRMNRKARAIGLSSATSFANATGLSSKDIARFEDAASKGETEMTAKDAALLARYLIRRHPEILETTSRMETEGAVRTASLKTTNEMLPGQRFGTAGNDGLKTGYTERAGYCFTGTTMKNGKRYITVVMGAKTPEARFEETRKLLAYAPAAE